VNNRRRVTAMMHDRRLVDEKQEFTGEKVVQKLFKDVAPKFNDRDGGYTRIIKLSDYRIGDAASLVILQLLTDEAAPTGNTRRSAGLRRKRNLRKVEFAKSILKQKKGSDGAAPAAAVAAPAPEGEATPPTTN
jgi:hypothetical protein